MSPVLFYVGPSLTVNRMIWRTEKWEGGGREKREETETPSGRRWTAAKIRKRPVKNPEQKNYRKTKRKKKGANRTLAFTHTHTH